ncbi:MAG: chloride channel protein [Kiritimatiellae bacterium]|nr:chloride channel protein [Kiritimatiellia bacterium]
MNCDGVPLVSKTAQRASGPENVDQVPRERAPMDRRSLRLCGFAVVLGFASAVIALVLMWLISFVTNLAFYGRVSIAHASPAEAVPSLGIWVLFIPVAGALLVGLMARFGSKAIRGHGIPEAMEQILTNRSKIPARVTVLKPVSSALAIGTGGPFGAEGPIIATGGALGSLLGQLTSSSPAERKTLLAAGAAAGMAATFGSPVSAVLLAVELLLFEYRARSIIPVALAAVTATGLRLAYEGPAPVFGMPNVAPASLGALVFYVLLGGAMGLIAAAVTRIVYWIEDGFERLPIHWMWWPAIGAVAVGGIGYFVPDTLGVGYYNISAILADNLPLKAVALLCTMKFVSWAIALGSGTSGGTLAPLFTIGGGIGALIGAAAVALLPAAGIDLRVAALVGMAALFSGASRALLASAVFAFETTLEPMSLLPLLGGCAAAYFVSSVVMRNTIMTEKLARRGVSTPSDFATDPLEHVLVRDIAASPVVTIEKSRPIREVQEWIASGTPEGSHQGYPIVDEHGTLFGVLTRRDILANRSKKTTIGELIAQMPRYVYDDCTVRQAADHMVNHGIGRLPVVNRAGKPRIVGIVTRSDILSSYRDRIAERTPEAPSKSLPLLRRPRAPRD